MKFCDRRLQTYLSTALLVAVFTYPHAVLAAISVTGDVNTDVHYSAADAFTKVKWSYSDIPNSTKVKSYAEITIGTNLLDDTTVECTNFSQQNNQQCIAIAEANQCTPECNYCGRGDGHDRRFGTLWFIMGDWDQCRVCESGPGN